MAGDVNNAHIWADADVYITYNLDAAEPASVDDDFDEDWDLVGLLNGDDGYTYPREEDVNDHFAWGGVLVRTSRAHFKQTVKWTALEKNDTTFGLAWPGSTRGGDIVVPKPIKHKIALQKRDGDNIHRLISANYCESQIDGDLVEKEAELTQYPFITKVFPDASVTPAVLFHEQETGVSA